MVVEEEGSLSDSTLVVVAAIMVVEMEKDQLRPELVMKILFQD
jgi:hypothetical protein